MHRIFLAPGFTEKGAELVSSLPVQAGWPISDPTLEPGGRGYHDETLQPSQRGPAPQLQPPVPR